MKLSKSQKEAIDHLDGPALILAVPGAGKTTVLMHRINNLICKHDIHPRSILSITFSKASCKDMEERFSSLYPDIKGVGFSTIHSFAYRIIRDYAISNSFLYTLIESNKSPVNKYSLLRELYYKHNKKPITEDKLDSLINEIGFVKNMIYTDLEIQEEYKSSINNFYNIFSDYEQIKLEKNLIDFDDMLTFSLDILKSDGQLLEKYRKLYPYIQVDEAQDTSKAQIEIIKLLAYPNNNLLIVADDDQSIYGFRGAYPDELFNFEKIYKNSKIFYMEDNFRSTKSIVHITNNFIGQNTIRFKKNIKSNSQIETPINLTKVRNLDKQYSFLIKDLAGVEDYNKTAILFRNNISSIGIMDALNKNNIPFQNSDTKLRFFNHFIIKDIKNFFELAANPSSFSHFEKIYYKMKGFISKKQMQEIAAVDYKNSVFQRLLNIKGINSFYQNNFYDLEMEFDRLAKSSFKEGISIIEYNLEYNEYLRDSAKRFGQTYESLKNILSLIKIIGKDSSNLYEFLDRLDELQGLAKNKTSDGIVLSTIHSAKGLEFDNVYIVDLLKDEFPNSKSIEDYQNNDIKEYEEERRLLYVAMTRAKNKLTLIVPGNKTPLFEASVFVDEIRNL